MPQAPLPPLLPRRGPRSTSLVVGLAALLTAALLSVAPTARAQTVDWEGCAAGGPDRQADFDLAARTSGVPVEVLLGVSYLLTRWDDHGSSPSTSGGFGPMHLTVPPNAGDGDTDPLGRGDDQDEALPSRPDVAVPDEERLETLARAAELTGLDVERLRTESAANICGGAALLAAYQETVGGADDFDDWSAAIARYAGEDHDAALHFAEQVMALIRDGERRTTNDGEVVRLQRRPGASVDVAAIDALGLESNASAQTQCPDELACWWVPAPYVQYGTTDTEFGNHNLANRPDSPAITSIVIHDTETTFAHALQLVRDPTYVSWEYTIRSTDGLIAQHVDADDIAWHAGNWYVNSHSIGVEHEGFAAHGATWYTEIMYRNSAELVGWIADNYDIPLDRAHIRGHDNVPAPWPSLIPSMHWDPGPFWDWEHYFDLLGAPIGESAGPGRSALARGRDHAKDRSGHPGKGQAHRIAGHERVVTVAPGFDDNVQLVEGCSGLDAVPCRPQGTNFVYLHTEPSFASPLVGDAGLHPGGLPSTRYLSDIGARAPAGHRFHVQERRGDWLGVWYRGRLAWLHSPVDDPKVVPDAPGTHARVVMVRGKEPIDVYGEALPDASAYPAQIPPKSLSPLGYTIEPGQSYVLAQADVITDYYYAKTFGCDGVPLDCTNVVDQPRYHLVWFGYRMAYVQADDVRIVSARRR